MDERSVPTGRPLVLPEPGSAFAVPLPPDVPYLVRALWTTERNVAIQDASGGVHHVEPGQDAVIRHGAVEVRLFLAEQFLLKRSGNVSARGSLAWLAIVVASSVLTAQAVWLEQNRCGLAFALLPGLPDVGGVLLFGIVTLLCLVVAVFVLITADRPRRVLPVLALPLLGLVAPFGYWATGATYKTGDQFFVDEFQACLNDPHGNQAGGSLFTAEYLARLLKNDLDGDDRGVIERDVERPEAARKLEEKHVFLPAGSAGPITRMGGAERVAPTPVRSMSEEERRALEATGGDAVELASELGRPVERQTADERAGKPQEIDVAAAEARKAEGLPAEEQEGWGIPAWYDEEDAALDHMEIDLALRVAKQRLRIDPNDAAALSILSYYQYLAQDFDGAKKTYDRYIDLYPDDAAGYNNKALIYKRIGEYQKEESLYRVALSLAPDDVTAMNNLGVNLAHQKRFDEALAVMKHLEVVDPEDAYAELHRSKIHAEMGQDDQALVYLELALEGMAKLDTLHHIEFRQDIRLDPSFAKLRETFRFRAMLDRYYGKDSPLRE